MKIDEHSVSISQDPLFSCWVVSDSETPWTAASQASCPSLSPGVCSNSCPLSWWCYTIISSSVAPLSSHTQIFPSIRQPKYWRFSPSISPSNENSGLVSFRINWWDLLAVQRDTQESSPTPQLKSINSSALSFLYSPSLTPIHDYWKTIALTRGLLLVK